MKAVDISGQRADPTARLLRELQQMENRARPLLAQRLHYNRREAAQVMAEIRRELILLAPQVPYIGGKQNPHTWNLEESALFLAAYRVLKRHGLTVEEIGRLFYDLTDRWYRSYPPLLRRLLGWWRFTPFYQRGLRRSADRSQQQRYPGDFIYTFVPGRRPDYDFGVDFTACGICKFYQAQGAQELLPYLCLLDYPLCRAFGLGLRRTTTLAEGGPRCDFRFKRGRTTLPGWPPRWLPATPRQQKRRTLETEGSATQYAPG